MSAFAEIFKYQGTVTASMEFRRIEALPRRVLDLDSVQDVTPLFAKSGELSFWPIQSAALIEAALMNGLFGMVGVGKGKTLICLALPEAFDSKRAVYLTMPELKEQLGREMHSFYGKHFHLPVNRLHVVAYSELSSAKKAAILESIQPDLIIADEAHCLGRKESARTKRFLRYMEEHPGCRFAALSGTFTTRSITEYAHLAELALRKNTPLPRGYREIRDWAGAIDVKPEYPMSPGVLRRFCRDGESVREGFQRRLAESPGVIITTDSGPETELIIRKTKPEVPEDVERLIKQTKKTWEIEGTEIDTAIDMTKTLKQLSCGFYYRWVWPDDKPDYEWLEARKSWNGEVREKLKHSSVGLDSPLLVEQAAERYYQWAKAGFPRPAPDKRYLSGFWNGWLDKFQKNYNQKTSRELVRWVFDGYCMWESSEDQTGGTGWKSFELGRLVAFWNRQCKQIKESIDEDLLVEIALDLGRWEEEGRPTPIAAKMWQSEFWRAWREVKHRPKPPRKAVWISDFVVDAAIEWARRQSKPAIIWYAWSALGARIAHKGRFPFYGKGTDASESRDPVIVASIRAQSTGKNLQYHFSQNLLTTLPSSGKALEQLLGRTHRSGQKESRVTVDWFAHTHMLEAAMESAREDAVYMQETTGQRQRLLYAMHC